MFLELGAPRLCLTRPGQSRGAQVMSVTCPQWTLHREPPGRANAGGSTPAQPALSGHSSKGLATAPTGRRASTGPLPHGATSAGGRGRGDLALLVPPGPCGEAGAAVSEREGGSTGGRHAPLPHGRVPGLRRGSWAEGRSSESDMRSKSCRKAGLGYGDAEDEVVFRAGLARY